MAGRFLASLPLPLRRAILCIETKFFWEALVFSASFSPVRESFDFNPLAIPVQAGLRPARNKEEGAYPAM